MPSWRAANITVRYLKKIQTLVYPGNLPEMNLVHALWGVWSLLMGIMAIAPVLHPSSVLWLPSCPQTVSYLTHLGHFFITTVLWTSSLLNFYLDSVYIILHDVSYLEGYELEWNPPGSGSGFAHKNLRSIVTVVVFFGFFFFQITLSSYSAYLML